MELPKKKCREVVMGSDGEPHLCNTELGALEVQKPFAPFTAEQNHGVEEAPQWTIVFCTFCHTASIRG